MVQATTIAALGRDWRENHVTSVNLRQCRDSQSASRVATDRTKRCMNSHISPSDGGRSGKRIKGDGAIALVVPKIKPSS